MDFFRVVGRTIGKGETSKADSRSINYSSGRSYSVSANGDRPKAVRMGISYALSDGKISSWTSLIMSALYVARK